MTTFKCEIDMDNAAFVGPCVITDESDTETNDDCDMHEHEPTGELGDILRDIARKTDEGFTSAPKIMDSNGNTVGKWSIT